MYNTNIALKTILTIIFVIVACFMQNYYLFWLVLFYILLLCIVDRNLISLVITFFIALLLLFVYFTAKIRLLVIGLTIIDLLVLYFTSFTKRDLWKIKYEVKYKSVSKRKELFRENFRNIIDSKNRERIKRFRYQNCDVEELVNKKNDSDTKDMYNYSRVRFYGYDTTITSLFAKWSMYDLFVLVVSCVVLLLIYKFW